MCRVHRHVPSRSGRVHDAPPREEVSIHFSKQHRWWHRSEADPVRMCARWNHIARIYLCNSEMPGPRRFVKSRPSIIMLGVCSGTGCQKSLYDILCCKKRRAEALNPASTMPVCPCREASSRGFQPFSEALSISASFRSRTYRPKKISKYHRRHLFSLPYVHNLAISITGGVAKGCPATVSEGIDICPVGCENLEIECSM